MRFIDIDIFTDFYFGLADFLTEYYLKIFTIVLLTTGRSPLLRGRLYGAKIIIVIISTNSSLLRSLTLENPVRDGLFIEIYH